MSRSVGAARTDRSTSTAAKACDLCISNVALAMLLRGALRARASWRWPCSELEFKLSSLSGARLPFCSVLTGQLRSMGRCCGSSVPALGASCTSHQDAALHTPAPAAPPPPQFRATHYKRVLPSPPAIDFSGDEGAAHLPPYS